MVFFLRFFNVLLFLLQDEETWKGYFYAALLFGSSIVWTVTFHLYNQEMSVTSLQVRNRIFARYHN